MYYLILKTTILHDRSKHILKNIYFGINDTCLHEEYIYK